MPRRPASEMSTFGKESPDVIYYPEKSWEALCSKKSNTSVSFARTVGRKEGLLSLSLSLSFPLSLAHTHTNIRTHTHTHMHTSTLSLNFARTVSRKEGVLSSMCALSLALLHECAFSFSRSRILASSLARARARARAVALSFSSSHARALSLSRTRALSFVLSLSHVLCGPLSRSLCLSHPVHTLSLPHTYTHILLYIYTAHAHIQESYGVATIRRLLKIIGLFCKRAL